MRGLTRRIRRSHGFGLCPTPTPANDALEFVKQPDTHRLDHESVIRHCPWTAGNRRHQPARKSRARDCRVGLSPGHTLVGTGNRYRGSSRGCRLGFRTVQPAQGLRPSACVQQTVVARHGEAGNDSRGRPARPLEDETRPCGSGLLRHLSPRLDAVRRQLRRSTRRATQRWPSPALRWQSPPG